MSRSGGSWRFRRSLGARSVSWLRLLGNRIDRVTLVTRRRAGSRPIWKIFPLRDSTVDSQGRCLPKGIEDRDRPPGAVRPAPGDVRAHTRSYECASSDGLASGVV